MSDVTDLLDRLTAGSTTLEDVARAFETREWPQPASDAERQAAALRGDDPEPITEGSFDEVASAYVNGDLDDEQYAVLAQAAAKGMGASGTDPSAESGAADAASTADTAPAADAPPAGDAATPTVTAKTTPAVAPKA